MNPFVRSILDLHPLPETDLNRLLEAGEELDIPKGTVLVREGQVNRSLHLIQSGVFRAYRTDEDRETTLWFGMLGETVFSSWGYIEGTPARVSIAATCDSRVLRYSKETAEALFASSPDLAVWGRRVFEQLLLVSDLWLVELTKPRARDRYLALAEKMPEILLNVSLKDIAAYLAITPQTLSRIRAELARERKG